MQRLRRLLRSKLRAGHDFAEEIESHIALEAERLVAEGWSASDAAHEARRRFGNVGAAKERFHDARVVAVLETILQDMRYGLRALGRTPVFATIAVLSLALAIGANTAMFTVVNAVLFRPLPVAHPEQLVMVRPDQGLFNTTDYLTVARFRAYRQLFSDVAAVHALERSNIMIDGRLAGRAVVHLVTGDYFGLFGVRAAVGRTITMDDERAPGAHPVVVISDAYWRTAFAASPQVLGRTLTLNGTAFVVVGVAPREFTGDEVGLPADLWMPIMMQPVVMAERPNMVASSRSWVRMLARLAPGMTMTRAERLATDAYRQILSEPRPDRREMTAADRAEMRVTLSSERRGYTTAVGDKTEPMVVLWGIVALVLAIAYVNVAGLLLVRAAARERELATRLALGASVGRVARLLLTEGALIGVAASVLGAGIAVIGAQWLARVAASGVQPLHLSIVADARVLALTIATSLGAILICGLVPARRAARLSVAAGLKVSRGSGARGARSPFGRVLVVAQVALAVTLVVAAGLFTRTLSALESQDTGFDRDHLLEVTVASDQASFIGEPLANLFDAAVERLGALPGVDGVAVSTRGLLAGLGRGAVNTTVPGYVRPADEQPFIPYSYITPTFFRAAGMTLLSGRAFGPSDIGGHPRVAVISEAMARHYYGTVNAVGKRFGTARDVGAPIEVVGVVRDAKDASLRDEAVSIMYLPYRQGASRLTQMCIIVRTQGDPAALVGTVRRALHDLDAALPVTSVETMRSQMRGTITMEWFTALVSTFFGAVALLLAALGVFAIVAQAVVARTSEIGIRIALGATASLVTRLILGESLMLVAVGLVVGDAMALLASRATAARLFGVSPLDAPSFAAATAIMTCAALAAALLPTRRATRIDPAISLRHE